MDITTKLLTSKNNQNLRGIAAINLAVIPRENHRVKTTLNQNKIMNLNDVPNYYFEFGCDFRIFLQSLDASRKPSRKNLFKVSELMLCTGHYGETMSWQQFDELYDEYAQIQINGKTNQDNSDCWFEMMVTFPRRKVFCYVPDGFSLYSTHLIEDFDEIKAIINKCFELTVKNS